MFDNMDESLRADKGTARHVDASGVLCTLMDSGKLTNQFATLLY